MATDLFASAADSTIAPARAPFPITPDDAAALTVVPKAIYVGTGGTLVLRGIAATADVSFKNVASGQTIDVRASHIRQTGTTAADLVGLV